jgi:hypothetical protein
VQDIQVCDPRRPEARSVLIVLEFQAAPANIGSELLHEEVEVVAVD